MRFGHVSIWTVPPLGIPLPIGFRWKKVFTTLVCTIALSALTACQNSEAAASQAATQASELLAQNRIAEARLAIGEAIALRDDVPEYFLIRGRIELAGGSRQGAFEAFLNAVALDPANPEALQAVSQLGLQTGNWSESLDATEAILSLEPNNASALLTRGLHSLFSSRFDDAEADADKVLELNPFSEEGTILKARILSLRGNYALALAMLDEYAKTRPPSTSMHLIRLEIFRANRDVEGMDRQFDLLRDAVPEDLDLAVDQVNFLIKTNRTDEATQAAYALLANPALSPRQAGSIANLLASYGLALSHIASLRAIAQDGDPLVRYSLATMLAQTGQNAAARVLAPSLRPDDRDAILADVALAERKFGEAQRLVEGVLTRDPDHCLALRVRAAGLGGRGEFNRALRDAQRAADQCPEDTEAWRLAAMAYANLGDPENARREWRQGSEANPQDVGFARQYAFWLSTQRASREAVAVMRRLTHNTPASVPAWQAYVDICQEADQSCLDEARQGLAEANTKYWIDYGPGEQAAIGLFGRLVGN